VHCPGCACATAQRPLERRGQVPRADVSAHLAQLAALYHRASPTLEAACATFAPLEGGDGAAAAQAGPGPACWEGPISGDPAAVRALARLHPARLLAADPDPGPGPWRQGAPPGAPRGALSTLWKAVWCLHTLRLCCACATSKCALRARRTCRCVRADAWADMLTCNWQCISLAHCSCLSVPGSGGPAPCCRRA